MWKSPIPENRWIGFRRFSPGIAAFNDLETFEKAAASELYDGFSAQDLITLGRLLKRGVKAEIEVFIRTHGPNPLFDPKHEIEVPIGVAKADLVDLHIAPAREANNAILNGEVVHVLFQAGEASRFQVGPLYRLNPFLVAREDSGDSFIASLVDEIEANAKNLQPKVREFLLETGLGPKQVVAIRAGLRRVIQDEIDAGRLPVASASKVYEEALARQKILFFVSRKDGVAESHDEALRRTYNFFGFDPTNVVTIGQELARGVVVDEEGNVSLVEDEGGRNAAGHLYALIQAARTGDFTTYTASGRPSKPREADALAYLAGRGGKILSVIRINDMDRHTTEIINAKALAYALQMFQRGYVNVIETVSNPEKQKGGTGLTFGDADLHVLTETHENSFPALSRRFEQAMNRYVEDNNGRHPSYNAMRQWVDLAATRVALKEFGGRIVFVPRQKNIDGRDVTYLGVDMPMGDLSLLYENYKSRMFQLAGPKGYELLIHDMKTKDNLAVALRTLLRQLSDPHILAAVSEQCLGGLIPFQARTPRRLYGAPAPEFGVSEVFQETT